LGYFDSSDDDFDSSDDDEGRWGKARDARLNAMRR
jgi:hypothetical protein